MLMAIAVPLFTACDDDDENDESPQSASIVGTWRMDKTTSKGSLTIMLTFKSNGTVRCQEFDNGKWDADELFTYTYYENVLKIYYNSEKTDYDVIEVSVLNSQKLILKDWPDKGFNTFYRQ